MRTMLQGVPEYINEAVLVHKRTNGRRRSDDCYRARELVHWPESGKWGILHTGGRFTDISFRAPSSGKLTGCRRLELIDPEDAAALLDADGRDDALAEYFPNFQR